jgi:hypothetical protein
MFSLAIEELEVDTIGKVQVSDRENRIVNWFPAAIRQFFDRHQTAVGVVKTKQ